jgi:hypothetical protein
VLGYCTVTLGLLTGHGFYPIDFPFYFSKKRNAKTPFVIGVRRSSSGQRSYEAHQYSKLELAFMLISKNVSNCWTWEKIKATILMPKCLPQQPALLDITF